MREAHTYDQMTDTDEFFFSGRAWRLNWISLALLFAMQVGSLYVYQRGGGVTSLLAPIVGAVFTCILVLGVAHRSHPVLVVSGKELEYVDLFSLRMRPKKVPIDGVAAVSDIKGTLHLRYESGAFERLPINLIEASARSAVVDSIKRRISGTG